MWNVLEKNKTGKKDRECWAWHVGGCGQGRLHQGGNV